jgi:17beta-estradiol 17-dehydrogenase / very-long-chain 3-oxoacyl-CoA reductase
MHLNQIDVGILINNVGVMHECPNKFDEISEEAIWDMINVNIGAVTMMTKIIIPRMKHKNRGLILNVSSGAHCQPMPLAAVYGATKSYTKTFTIGEIELKNSEVIKIIIMFL